MFDCTCRAEFNHFHYMGENIHFYGQKDIIQLLVCFETTFLDMYIDFFHSIFKLDVRVLWFD